MRKDFEFRCISHIFILLAACPIRPMVSTNSRSFTHSLSGEFDTLSLSNLSQSQFVNNSGHSSNYGVGTFLKYIPGDCVCSSVHAVFGLESEDTLLSTLSVLYRIMSTDEFDGRTSGSLLLLVYLHNHCFNGHLESRVVRNLQDEFFPLLLLCSNSPFMAMHKCEDHWKTVYGRILHPGFTFLADMICGEGAVDDVLDWQQIIFELESCFEEICFQEAKNIGASRCFSPPFLPCRTVNPWEESALSRKLLAARAFLSDRSHSDLSKQEAVKELIRLLLGMRGSFHKSVHSRKVWEIRFKTLILDYEALIEANLRLIPASILDSVSLMINAMDIADLHYTCKRIGISSFDPHEHLIRMFSLLPTDELILWLLDCEV